MGAPLLLPLPPLLLDTPLELLLDTPLELPLLPPELLPVMPLELPVMPLELPVVPLELPLLPPGPPSPRYSIARPPQPELARAALRKKPRKEATGRRGVRTTPTQSERRAKANRAESGGARRSQGVSR
jgi:hypothetical protein